MADEPKTRPASALDRLAAGGRPLLTRESGPVPLLRTRKPSLEQPKARLLQSQGGSTKTGPIMPASVGDLAKVAVEQQVAAHSRRSGSRQVAVRAYERDQEDTPERPVFVASPASKQRAATDLELWNAWRSLPAGSKERRKAFSRLLARFRGLIQQQVNRAAATIDKSNIPRSAVEAEVTSLVINGLKTYDPNRGAQITTYLTTQFRGMPRFMGTYGYAARMPDELVNAIGPVRRAREHLLDLLGRNPTDEEVSQYSGKSLKTVVRLSRELHRGLVRSEHERDPAVVTREPVDEILALLQPELSDREKTLLGLLREAEDSHDEKAIRPAVLAKRMGLSGPELSNLKRSLTEKVMRHLRHQPVGITTED